MPEALQRFNWVDVLVLIFLIRTSYIGAKAGLSVELFRIAGVLLGLYLSFAYYQTIGLWMTSAISLQPEMAESISFALLVLVPMLVLKLTDWVLSKVVKLAFSERIGQWGGFLCGLARGLILLSLLLTFFGVTQIDYLVKSVDEGSMTGPYMKQVAPYVRNVLTMNFTRNTSLFSEKA